LIRNYYTTRSPDIDRKVIAIHINEVFVPMLADKVDTLQRLERIIGV
jgi:hypothetical protein